MTAVFLTEIGGRSLQTKKFSAASQFAPEALFYWAREACQVMRILQSVKLQQVVDLHFFQKYVVLYAAGKNKERSSRV